MTSLQLPATSGLPLAPGWARCVGRAAARLLAALLRGTARRLLRAARVLQAAEPATDSASPGAEPACRVEFHCEAGAPEGALYVDGRLVGHLIGVRRL